LSSEAVELFERARHGSFSAAGAVMTLLRSAERLKLLPLDRDLAGKCDPRGCFWLPRGRAIASQPVADLFAGAPSDDAERGT
jgi:hypothetical protein